MDTFYYWKIAEEEAHIKSVIKESLNILKLAALGYPKDETTCFQPSGPKQLETRKGAISQKNDEEKKKAENILFFQIF